jgi:hypothetical protein
MRVDGDGAVGCSDMDVDGRLPDDRKAFLGRIGTAKDIFCRCRDIFLRRWDHIRTTCAPTIPQVQADDDSNRS